MSTQTTPPTPVRQRHALGLPAGSIRSILALSILAILWLMVWKLTTSTTSTRLPSAFIYLQFLMVLILTHFFSAHGKTIGSHLEGGTPLGLPNGTIRLLLLIGYGGLAYFLYMHKPEFDLPPQGDLFLLLAMLLSAFFLGHYLTRIVTWFSRGVLPYWYQDIQAWAALMAAIALAIMMVIQVFINPTLSNDIKIDASLLDIGLAALVGFYFGSR